MKHIIIFVFCCIIVLTSFSYSQYSWEWCYGTPQGNSLNYVEKQGSSWYFVGNNGTFIKTTDAGGTWFINNKAGKVLYNALMPYYSDLIKIHFFNNLTGVAIGEQKSVMRTTNGGITFDSITNLPVDPINYPSNYLKDMVWINSLTGFISAYNSYYYYSRIYKSTDGGLSWDTLTSRFTQTSIEKIWTQDGLTIFAVGGYYIYRSTNGGISWDQSSVSFSASAINFMNALTGFAGDYNSRIIRTTNGGNNWVSATQIVTYQINPVSEIQFSTNGNVFVSLMDTSYIYKSTDLGNSWDSICILASGQPKFNKVKSFSYGSDGVFIVVGDNGEINVCSPVSPPVTYTNILKTAANEVSPYYKPDIMSRPNGKALVVFRHERIRLDNQIIVTSNGGSNWSIQPFPAVDLTLIGITAPTENNIWVIGNNEYTNIAYIIRSTNGGLSWNNLFSPVPTNIKKVFFVDSNTGWISYNSSVPIYKTTNSGDSWVAQTNGLNGPIYSISFVNLNTGWVVGGASLLSKTTNGGQNWITQTMPSPTVPLADIKMLDTSFGYACGYRKVIKTSNGGTMWQNVLLPSPYNNIDFLSIDCYDSSHVIVSGKSPYILHSTNGGQNWFVEYTGSEEISVVSMFKADSAYAVTYAGHILRMKTDGAVGINNYSYPSNYSLKQNYPNPFNPVTIIKYSLPKSGQIKIEIFDVLGKCVTELVNEQKIAGTYEVEFDARNQSSGVYFYRIQSGDFTETKKMVLIK